jgi:hypothetical protein
MLEEVFEQFIDSQLALKLGQEYKKYHTYIPAIEKINNRNRELNQTLEAKEARIVKLENICANLAAEIKTLSLRMAQFEKTSEAAQPAETNAIINKFNIWAANPVTPLPSAFAYLSGDFRIRTVNQQIISTQDESKWIVNREGKKIFLLPNPRFFNQMTNILELYEMDQKLLKEKGKNKINIIIPCEISSTGFVEFPGKLEILP